MQKQETRMHARNRLVTNSPQWPLILAGFSRKSLFSKNTGRLTRLRNNAFDARNSFQQRLRFVSKLRLLFFPLSTYTNEEGSPMWIVPR